MSSVASALRWGAHSAALAIRPGLGALFLFRIALGIAFVAAIVFVAWKIGSYYDAAKKKL